MSETTMGCFAPCDAMTGLTLQLSMQRLWLEGQVLPAGARLTVQHVFRSEEEDPVEVIYSFALPRDASLRAFRITGDGFETHSELRATEEAVKEYERGVAQGSLSALARQYGDGVVNLTVGNIRPGETVTVWLDILAGLELRDNGFRFRFPFTLAPTYHPLAKYAETAPGEGEIELPGDAFGDVILPRFRSNANGLHEVGFSLSVSSRLELAELGSPSHATRVKGNQVSLAPEKDIPNRDLILEATYSRVEPQVLAGGGHFAAIIPSTSFGVNPDTPRTVAILLDKSGSMQGERLTQATRAIAACLGALSDEDSFGLVAFSSTAEALGDSVQRATRANRDSALEFLRRVAAGGGTELVTGVQRAAQVLGPAGGGDIIIFTDGEVGGVEAILARVRASGVRLHCLGIGDASQDRFLALLARETGGVSRYVSPGERVDLTAVDLFASVGRPVAAGLRTAANVQPAPPAAVFAGTPVLLFGESGEAAATLELEWDGGGRLGLPFQAGADDQNGGGETLRLLQGSRLITDWESRYPAAEALAPLEKRQQSRVAVRLAQLSRTYGLASREMSLVAVVKRTGDRAGELPQTRVVPVGTPRDAAFGAYVGGVKMMVAHDVGGPFTAPTMMMPPVPPSPAAPSAAGRGFISALVGSLSKKRHSDAAPQTPPAETVDDVLLRIAAQLEGDGGMPGGAPEERAGRSVAALCAFIGQGHTASSGAFRAHVGRLVKFLTAVTGLDPARRRLVDTVLEAAARGEALAGDWLRMADQPSSSGGGPWSQIERATAQVGKSVKL